MVVQLRRGWGGGSGCGFKRAAGGPEMEWCGSVSALVVTFRDVWQDFTTGRN